MRKLLLPILVFTLVLSSCTDDLTSLNEDPKSASDVPAEPLFSNALVSLGTATNQVNININIFTHMAQYWSQTTYNATSAYLIANRGISDNYWGEIYRDVLNDLNESSSLISEDEVIPDAQKQTMQAQIEVVRIMAYYQLVTIFGDVPYTEALESPSPAYNGQAEIYADLMSRLNGAIDALSSGSEGFEAGSDVFYGGDIAAWERFANSLKMRMAMTVVDNPPSGVDPQAAFEEASPNAFTSNEHNLSLQYNTSQPHANPVYENVVASGRDDFIPSNTLIDKMNNLNDPRRAIHFSQVGGAYMGAPYGAQNNYADFSHIVGPFLEPDLEGMLLEYAEVEFLRAEANARGWLTGTAAQAQIHYNQAIEADMQYWSDVSGNGDISPAQITTYQTTDAPFPVAGTLQDQLKAIAEQKWLALYMQGLQAWTEWRRLDHPTFYYADIENVDITSEDDIPVRFTYPTDEQNLNQANWETAASSIGGDELSTLLFWDTGLASSVN